jgi:hypothetical protein
MGKWFFACKPKPYLSDNNNRLSYQKNRLWRLAGVFRPWMLPTGRDPGEDEWFNWGMG